MSEEKNEQSENGQAPVVEDKQSATSAEEAESVTATTAQQVNSDDLHLLLEDTRAKVDEYWDQLVRARAELDNLRKRNERDVENAHKYAIEGFVRELLQVKDSMELGLSAAMDETADVQKLREGTELTLKILNGTFEKFNVEEVDPVSLPFDPQEHQAMSMQPRDDVPPNTVITVVQKGYRLNGRLVRPAMVIVSQQA